ncbi:unnamed protein product (mitochondrion) [Plasmodiophora brassicae]|uniref:Uncharacterized protein n=2 Tax=Plasmodiophora brassicae TaxID=37360 RepID=A0A3P3YNE2_PLABS|nr:unnamed protein product [Plasmodiophora brassicae]
MTSKAAASPSPPPPTGGNTIETILSKAEQLSRAALTGLDDQLAAPPPPPPAARPAGQRSRRRMTEKEEDAVIMKDEATEEMAVIPRFDVQPPNIVGGTMKSYQLAGLNWLIRLYETNVNGILADEMGLGKTLQTISLVAYLRQYRNVTGQHLMVVPKSTMGNWVNEFTRWCPDVDVLAFHGNREERADMIRERLAPRAFDVCVTSYEMVLREKGAIKKIPWHLLVVDEAHRLKNESSILSQVLRMFQSKARLLITGTPLQNNLHELWALLNFLMPRLFDSASEFDAFLNVTNDAEDHSNLLSKLHAILRPFLLRRLKTDVAKDIPPKKETLLYVGMSALQREIYRSIFTRDMDAIQGSTKSSKRLLNIVMQLRKAANHPYLFEGVEDRSLPAYGDHMILNSGKMVVLDKLLPRLRALGSRVLVFSQMTRVLDILEDFCHYRDYDYCRIDGSTSSEDRDAQMREFNAEGSSKFIFLLSTRAGGLGINLQTADIVILFDSDWNPQMDLQAQDRAHRIGQKKPVHVYRLVTEHTIEEKVIERAELKLRLDAMVIQQGRLADRSTKMSKGELVALIRYGADEVFRSKDSTITDEDIDIILSKGAERTEQLAAKMGEFERTSLASFAMGDVAGQEAPSADDAFLSLAGAGGKDDGAASDLAFLNKVSEALGKRERVRPRTSYDVDQYYKEVMERDQRSRRKGPSLVPRPKRLPQLFDFQFLRRDRIIELSERELERWSLSLDAPDIDALPPALTDEELAEKEALLAEGYSHWNKRDFNQYLRAMERHGRNAIDQIAKSVPSKTEDEVRAYHETFWSRYTELDGWEKIVKAIEKGEGRLVRANDVQAIIERKLNQCRPDPMSQLEFKYGAQHKGKGYTELNDRYLLVKTGEFGYGEWDRLHVSIRTSPLFLFDYFFKSRSPQELGRRVDILVRLIEKGAEKKNNGDMADDGAARKSSIRKKRVSAPSIDLKPPAKKARNESGGVDIDDDNNDFINVPRQRSTSV